MNPSSTLTSATPVPRRGREHSISAFIETYGPFFGRQRLEAIAARGKFLVENKSEGAYVHSTDGKRYLDFFCESGVYNLGHKNPAVLKAVAEALTQGPAGGTFYFTPVKGEFAKALSGTTPEGVTASLPAAGGGEAMDLAIKLAMAATGRSEFICGTRAYHGSAGLSVFLGPAHLREWFPFSPLTVRRVDLGDLENLARVVTEKTAAVVYEPARTLSDGYHPGPEYWQSVRALCDRQGAKLIIDEVVAGMGRLGEVWGSAVDCVRPDLMVMAKGLSGGAFPAACVALRPEILGAWGDNPYRSYSTFSGMNTGAAAALAAIRETERLLPTANAMAEKFESGLREIAGRHPGVVTGVRRTGLHLVMEFDPAKITGYDFTQKMFDRGVLLHAAGSIIDAPAKFFPPLILSTEHIDECLEKTEAVLRTVKA